MCIVFIWGEIAVTRATLKRWWLQTDWRSAGQCVSSSTRGCLLTPRLLDSLLLCEEKQTDDISIIGRWLHSPTSWSVSTCLLPLSRVNHDGGCMQYHPMNDTHCRPSSDTTHHSSDHTSCHWWITDLTELCGDKFEGGGCDDSDENVREKLCQENEQIKSNNNARRTETIISQHSIRFCPRNAFFSLHTLKLVSVLFLLCVFLFSLSKQIQVW